MDKQTKNLFLMFLIFNFFNVDLYFNVLIFTFKSDGSLRYNIAFIHESKYIMLLTARIKMNFINLSSTL